MVRSIHLKIDLTAHGSGNVRSVNTGRLLARIDTALPADLATVAPGIDGARREVHEALGPSAVERQLDDRHLAHHLAARAGARVHELRLSRDRDLAADLPHLQRDR